MSVEFISGILAGAAGTAHAERGHARPALGRAAAGPPRAASIGQSLETGDRDADGRQPWNSNEPAGPAVRDHSPAPSAEGDSSGERLDLLA